MRPDTIRSYARAAGFAEVDVFALPEQEFRFYRLVCTSLSDAVSREGRERRRRNPRRLP